MLQTDTKQMKRTQIRRILTQPSCSSHTEEKQLSRQCLITIAESILFFSQTRPCSGVEHCDISSSIEKAKYITIMASNKEQVVIFFRSVDDQFVCHEDFVGLYIVESIESGMLVHI